MDKVNVLSLGEFSAIIAELRIASAASDEMRGIVMGMSSDAGNELMVDFFDPCVLFSGHESALIRVLDRMFGFSADDDSVLSWWVYEMGFGMDCTGEDIVCSDGTTYDLRTVEGLYCYLLSNLGGDAEGESDER